MMSPYEKKQLLRLLKEAARAVELVPEQHRCLDCVSFSQGYCQRWDERVPDDFIEKGCDGWIFNEMSPPF